MDGAVDVVRLAISIHAPRTGSDPLMGIATASVNAISIHAPRTGSDGTFSSAAGRVASISIHAPRTGSDFKASPSPAMPVFQSTLPARGATGFFHCGAWYIPISIHAPRTGSDKTAQLSAELGNVISIHAPRTGSDSDASLRQAVVPNFNPRSPHGERRGACALAPRENHFNPRSPHGERRSDCIIYIDYSA